MSYSIETTTSKVESYQALPELDAIVKNLKKGWVVIWQHHDIFVVEVENGKLAASLHEADEKHFVRIRAFDKTTEYHFWRAGGGWRGRKRTDTDGTGTDYIDTKMVLRGSVGAQLPDDFGKDARIQTRNYIGYHPETHQAGYVDCRFVEFVKS